MSKPNEMVNEKFCCYVRISNTNVLTRKYRGTKEESLQNPSLSNIFVCRIMFEKLGAPKLKQYYVTSHSYHKNYFSSTFQRGSLPDGI